MEEDEPGGIFFKFWIVGGEPDVVSVMVDHSEMCGDETIVYVKSREHTLKGRSARSVKLAHDSSKGEVRGEDVFLLSGFVLSRFELKRAGEGISVEVIEGEGECSYFALNFSGFAFDIFDERRS